MSIERIVSAVVLAATTACVVAVTAYASTSNSPPCTPKVTTIAGHKAAVNCGPATVTLHVGGKTYIFRQGFCEQSKSAGSALELNLGTTVVGAKNNGGKSRFTLVIGHVHSAASVFSAYYGGREVLRGESLINVHGTIPAKGTFTSQFTIGAKFTGSWDCHGVVWMGP